MSYMVREAVTGPDAPCSIYVLLVTIRYRSAPHQYSVIVAIAGCELTARPRHCLEEPLTHFNMIYARERVTKHLLLMFLSLLPFCCPLLRALSLHMALHPPSLLVGTRIPFYNLLLLLLVCLLRSSPYFQPSQFAQGRERVSKHVKIASKRQSKLLERADRGQGGERGGRGERRGGGVRGR